MLVQAVYQLTSVARSDFMATGFLVRHFASSLMITCSHVIHAAGGVENLRVDGNLVQLVSHRSEANDLDDLVVLECKQLFHQPGLEIASRPANQCEHCEVAGFSR